MNNKIILGIAGLALVISVIALVGGNQSGSKSVGGTTNYDVVKADFIVGNSSVSDSFQTCNLIGTNASQLASTTKAYDCAISGLTSSDNVFAQLSTTTVVNTTNIGWSIVGAAASSTSGYATVLLSNMTGSAAIPSATSVGSSTKLIIYR